MSLRPLVVMIGILATVASCTRSVRPPGDVDTARIVAADDEPGNWLTHGRTYGEQRYSPLRAIDTGSVKRLGLAWSYDLAMNRGAEATPLVVDGVMYVTSAWSIVHAIDARLGTRLWMHDPKVDRAVGAKACCDVVNRGVAVYGGKVFVGVIDGRLVALDAATGSVAWETVTVDQSQAYTITGAPRAANGLVYIGNGGAELGVRGYVSAYDANTGSLEWRFYTVPGDPAKGPDGAASDPVMARASKTWTGEWWAGGGGGTAWDAIVTTRNSTLLVGVGNGSPWNQQVRSPGGGDNLFLSSIVALDAKTGAYRWHYQTTPGETWDYTATQPIMLADLTIDGRPRKVAMQAPKNGFFYVSIAPTESSSRQAPFSRCCLRATRRRVRPAGLHGRRRDRPAYRERRSAIQEPGCAHTSGPRRRTQLAPDVLQSADRACVPSHAGSGYRVHARSGVHAARGVQQCRGAHRVVPGRSPGPEVDSEQRQGGAARLGPCDTEGGMESRASWSVEWRHTDRGGRLGVPGHRRRTLPRARREDGRGAVVVRQPGRRASPGRSAMKWTANSHCAVPAGYGTSFFLISGFFAPKEGANVNARVYAFKLGGTASKPRIDFARIPTPRPPVLSVTADEYQRGAQLYEDYCLGCHGIAAITGGVLPDLRKSGRLHNGDLWKRAVVGAELAAQGMPRFERYVTAADAELIRAYVARQAAMLYEEEQAGGRKE